MALQVLNGPFIQAGESLSDGLDCRAGSIVRLTMPGNWTPANITFQISSDGAMYNDLVDMNANEIMVPIRAGSALVVAPLSDYLKAVAFIKIRSGSSAHPVVQEELREFAIAVEVA
jgi:hypothetical protein